MVYTGRPSRACQLCRTRRIKCDETKPACLQCAKARRRCPGYKSDGDLASQSKARAGNRRSKKPAPGNKDPGSVAPEDSSQDALDPALEDALPNHTGALVRRQESLLPLEIAVALTDSVETQAANHFVVNYIIVPTCSKNGECSYTDYVFPLLKSEGQNSAFSYAFKACALASLGNRPNAYNSDTASRSFVPYQAALRSIQSAINDPVKARSEATLGSVLLLAIYGTMMAKGVGISTWGRHIEGAVQLVQARGRSLLKTKLGKVLFTAVRSEMITYFLSTTKTPTMGAEWWSIDDPEIGGLANKCQIFNLIAAEIRAEVDRLMALNVPVPDKIGLIRETCARAKSLDREIKELIDNLPEDRKPRTLAWAPPVPSGDYGDVEVFPGRADLYPDIWISGLLNVVRVSRLALASAAVRCVAAMNSPADYRTTPDYAEAARVSTDTINDIIASVPFHLGWHLRNPQVLRRVGIDPESSATGYAGGTYSSLSGFFLTFPLGWVRSQDYCSDAQRRWIDGRLQYIDSVLGIRYANFVSNIQIRVPSMLIYRDGFMTRPCPAVQDDFFPKPGDDAMLTLLRTREDMSPELESLLQDPEKARVINNVLSAARTEGGPTLAPNILSTLGLAANTPVPIKPKPQPVLCPAPMRGAGNPGSTSRVGGRLFGA